MIRAIYIFYVMKFAPQFIDGNSSWFWRFNVRLLNNLRKPDTWKLFSVGRLSIRDPYSYPMKTYFAYSYNLHPFVWKKKQLNGGDL